MTVSRQMIERWLDEGLKKRATHVVIVVDRFDHMNYPIYFVEGHDPRKYIAKNLNGQNMQHVDEVYWLGGTPEQLRRQLDMPRAYCFGPKDLEDKA